MRRRERGGAAREALQADGVRRGEVDLGLDPVLQLADVSRPRVRLQGAQRVSSHRSELPPVDRRVLAQELLGEGPDVLPPLAEWRYGGGQHPPPGEKVGAEAPRFD